MKKETGMFLIADYPYSWQKIEITQIAHSEIIYLSVTA